MTGTSRTKIIAIILATILPVASIALMLWSFHDRADAASNLTAAVVNLDEMATIGEGEDAQPFPGGRLLTAGLTTNDDTVTWDIVSEKSAREGLDAGDYAAVIIIPKDFSANITGALSNNPRQANITVETNEANSQLVSFLAQYVSQTAAATTGHTITEMFINSTLTEVAPLTGGITDAADGATQLADGTKQLNDGIGQAAGGAGELAEGLDGATNGATQLASGAQQLNSGVGQLATGVQSASSGAGQLAGGAKELAGGAQELAGGAKELSTGLSQLNKEAKALPQGIKQLNTGTQGLSEGLDYLALAAGELPQATKDLNTGAQGVAQGAALVNNAIVAVNAACTDVTSPECAQALEALKKAKEASQGVVTGASELAAGTKLLSQSAPELANGIGELADGAAELADGTAELADQAPALTDGIGQLATGAKQLSSGTSELAGGAGQLSQGITQLAGGLSSAASGAGQLQSGSSQLATGTSELATGIGGAQEGAAGIADGLTQLEEGSGELAGGAGELAGGLTDASDQVAELGDIPESLGSVLAQPITSVHNETNPLGSSITGLAAAIAAIFMWVGAFALSLIHRIAPRRFLGTTVSTSERLRAGMVIPGIVTVVQVTALLAVLVAFGVKIANWPLTIAVLLIGTLTFMVLTEVFVLVWGRATGWLLSLLFFAVQAASVGGLLPIDTAPEFFQILNSLLPLPLAADALNGSIAGATSANAGLAVVGLIMWLLIAGATAWWATAREERWRPLPMKSAVA